MLDVKKLLLMFHLLCVTSAVLEKFNMKRISCSIAAAGRPVLFVINFQTCLSVCNVCMVWL